MASAKAKVWFHRSRALAWLIVGVISFPLGWANSVVWIASVYANVVSDFGAGVAADDRAVLERLDRLDRIEALLGRRAGDG